MDNVKRAQVIMLPNNKSTTSILKSGITGKLDGLPFLKENKSDFYCDLYIISDDEIKEGDWCLNISKNIIYQKDKLPMDIMWKKIIATTDTSLTLSSTTNYNGKSIIFDNYIKLPQPSQQFITKYIEEYNKSNIITDVLVEYENKFDGKEYVDDQDAYGYDKFKQVLKINSKDNTITIKKLKNSWNREEVIKLLKSITYTEFQKLPDWIEENL